MVGGYRVDVGATHDRSMTRSYQNIFRATVDV